MRSVAEGEVGEGGRTQALQRQGSLRQEYGLYSKHNRLKNWKSKAIC